MRQTQAQNSAMKKYFLTLGAVIIILGLMILLKKEKTVFSGRYVNSFETSAFSPNDSKEVWWVEGNLEKLSDGDCFKDVVFEGSLTNKGEYGHLGAYTRKLTVKKIIQATEIDCKEFEALK
ncbi:MAG: hypothetical protein V4691_10580 [Pseudomonadota bacterium]